MLLPQLKAGAGGTSSLVDRPVPLATPAHELVNVDVDRLRLYPLTLQQCRIS